jgi:two-component system, sensor histidine kinase and response regulator
MKNETVKNLPHTKSRSDLIIIAFLGIITFAVASYFEAFEEFVEWHEKNPYSNDWQLDEVIIVFVILGMALSIFSLRRWRELSREIKFHQQTEDSLEEMRDVAVESSRMKSEFLANMSHEIRTPMNGIIGMTELTLDTELTREQREYLEMVNSSAFNLLTVINDILDFSKIEAAKLDLHSDDFSLRECLAQAVKPLAILAQEKELELALDIATGIPDNITCDVTRLRQIIANLVGNAIKFTEKGEVVVRVDVEAQNEGAATLHLSVSDTGIGIPKDKQELIFNSFTQADGSTSRKYGGTGLGLSISARLVEMMGGKIWLESEPGQGSIFHATLRIQVRSGEEKVPQPISRVSLIAMPVLVVDDNATNRLILTKMLEGWGMRPVTTDSGSAALLLLRQAQESGKPFPLLILDGHMPEMDGFEVAERINQMPELIAPTIMMLTSGDRRGDSELCRRLGLAEYVLKPVTQAELLDAITRILCTKLASLPMRDDAAKKDSGVKESFSTRPLSILLAEDNRINQKLVTRLLEKRGHKVTTVVDGREALSALNASAFDVVLMDVQMPKMNGFEAVAAIRESEQTTGEHLPVIALTAHAMKGDRERCLAAGMDDYLPKPIQAAELYRILETAVTVSLRVGTKAS